MLENFDIVIDKATAEQISFVLKRVDKIDNSISESIRDYLFYSIKEREEQLQTILKKKVIVSSQCTIRERQEFENNISYHQEQAQEAKKAQQKARKELHQKIEELRKREIS